MTFRQIRSIYNPFTERFFKCRLDYLPKATKIDSNGKAISVILEINRNDFSSVYGFVHSRIRPISDGGLFVHETSSQVNRPPPKGTWVPLERRERLE